MMWLALIAAWAWFCLVFVDDNPMTGFWLLPVLLPASFVLDLVRRCCKRTNQTMLEFVEFCVALERGK